MAFSKLSEIVKISEERGLPFWQIILEDDLLERNTTYEESFDRMKAMFDAMIAKLPVPYRAAGLMNRLAFYVPWEVYDSYQNLLASRVDALGDVKATKDCFVELCKSY